MIWLWIGGGILVVAAALLPPVLLRAASGRREYRRYRDAARSVMSRLETEIDLAAAAATDGDAVAEAQRCATLAGAALAGPDTTDGFRQAEAWARKGLAALRPGGREA